MENKKLCLIGKFNAITQEVNKYLIKYFDVQLCSNNLEMVKGILDLSAPDFVLLNLIGLDKEDSRIFSELQFNHKSIACFCLGTSSEQTPFKQYFKSAQFIPLTRPISNSDMLEIICNKLKLKLDIKHDRVVDSVARGRRSILLVDDNPIQLRTLRAILQESYDVTMAVSGAEAMVAIGKKVPDMIFLDYEMPVCDGKMTLSMIRNLEDAKEVPVVFLTGVRDREHIRAVLDLKPAAYMLKPTTNEAILEMVKKILG